jgi:hypothetical protein
MVETQRPARAALFIPSLAIFMCWTLRCGCFFASLRKVCAALMSCSYLFIDRLSYCRYFALAVSFTTAECRLHLRDHHACIEGRGHYTGIDFGFCGAPLLFPGVAVGRNFRCNYEPNSRCNDEANFRCNDESNFR